MGDLSFDVEALLAQLVADQKKTETEYITLLFSGKYDEALDKATQIDLIEAHINRVEAL